MTETNKLGSYHNCDPIEPKDGIRRLPDSS